MWPKKNNTISADNSRTLSESSRRPFKIGTWSFSFHKTQTSLLFFSGSFSVAGYLDDKVSRILLRFLLRSTLLGSSNLMRNLWISLRVSSILRPVTSRTELLCASSHFVCYWLNKNCVSQNQNSFLKRNFCWAISQIILLWIELGTNIWFNFRNIFRTYENFLKNLFSSKIFSKIWMKVEKILSKSIGTTLGC